MAIITVSVPEVKLELPMSDLEDGEYEEMEEDEAEVDSNDDEEDEDSDDDEDEGGAGSLFDALAAAQEAADRYRESEKRQINESCKLPDDFLSSAFKTAIR